MKQLQLKYNLNLDGHILQVRISKKIEESRYRWVAQRHCNAEYELHILLKGRNLVEVEENHFFLEGRQGLIILPGQFHTPLDAKGEIEHFSVSFTVPGGEFAEILCNEISDFRVFSVSTDMLYECHSIYYECNTDNPYRNERIQALITSLMISVFRNLNLTSSQTTSLSTAEMERADIIDNFFSEELDDNNKGAAQLAEQLHLSERQLNRVIHQLYGMTFQGKMIQAKMDRASWLLRTTDKRVDEICELIGYSSEAAFYQAFRKYFKITPQKYRIQKK